MEHLLVTSKCSISYTDFNTIIVDSEHGQWIEHIISQIAIQEKNNVTLKDLRANYEEYFNDFEIFVG
mgnify:CR=1 FL=1